ncbi:MAG: acetyltransferase [halophilic archaeon J07HX64]|jgi:Acetyltransferases|nr:MAG: acetyltransferase [halophilic archaeon J07HX64]
MQIRRVRNDEAEIRRYVTDCWLSFQEDLTGAEETHALADDATEAAVEYHLEELDSPESRLWVALDGVGEEMASLSTVDGTFAGLVRTQTHQSPQRFDWPDRLEIEDCWVRERYRGTGLADDLFARAVQHAREDGCPEFTLTVGVDNERAVGYYEKLGFEVQGFGMRVPVEDLRLSLDEGPAGDATTHLRRVRAEEPVLRRFIEECWLPFWQEMSEAVGEQHLDPELDREELLERLVESYDTPDRRCWVGLDDAEDPATPLEDVAATFAGWINAGLAPIDPFLDPPERLFVGNLYAGPDYRGTGLADQLVARAMQYAREEGCIELVLGVEAGNDRALAYYEKLGFEPYEQRMAVPLDELELSATSPGSHY